MIRPGPVALAVAMALAPAAWSAPGAHVEAKGDAVVYTDAAGAARVLPLEGVNRDPVLSPDGRLIAYIHVDARSTDQTEGDRTSLWIVPVDGGAPRRLAAPHEGDEPRDRFSSLSHPTFSLDGGYVYVMAAAWVTSDAIHQVRVSTGAERFVVDGNSLAVLRNGRYAGYLIVSRHMYHPAPQYGAYDPCFVVRPDGKQTFMVPGTDKDSCDASMERWLAKNRYRAD